MTPLAASISDATIWSVTFDDTRSVDYDRNSFIIQATGLALLANIKLDRKGMLRTLTLFLLIVSVTQIFKIALI
jgi:hypothetical protein